MDNDKELSPFLKARNAAFEADDVDYFAKVLPPGADRVIVEIGFHRARLNCQDISKEKRLESKAWLRKRSLTDIMGRALLDNDHLAGVL